MRGNQGMKHILFTTLLVLAGNVFVFGQGGKDTVVFLAPDHMPCLKPSLMMVERMPMKKLDQRLIRPMPNGTPSPDRELMPLPNGKLKPVPMPGPRMEMAPPKKRQWQ